MEAATTCPFCGAVSAPPPRVVEKVVTVDHVVERVVVRDAVGNPTALPCLRCGQPMNENELGGSTVRQCRSCGGVWMPAEAVDHLRRVSDDDLRRAIALGEMLALARAERRTLACPVCAGPLECLELSETVFEVDVCRAHGTWFDRRELIGFMDREKERRENTPDPVENAADDDVDRGFFGKLRRLFSPG
jgi:Zn-finger nucleic acid-binding protein